MKLHWSPRSPFVRKVMIVAHETGIADRLQCVRTVAAMMKPHAGADDRQPAVEDPDPGARRRHRALRFRGHLRVLRRAACRPEAFSVGASRAHDGAAPPGAGRRSARCPGAVARRAHAAGGAAVAALSRELSRRATRPRWRRSNGKRRTLESSAFSVGHVAIGCALAYLDFRFADRQWRKDHPRLAAWHATFPARPSVRATEPVDDA